ncbi:MAG: DNA-3-methyladenine glycosylase 2 family protein [Euryarchaeota archaeon]|nr:DNA-3-methyladenine glycosylase 2 family protein [Euryarchaeota archaeon]
MVAGERRASRTGRRAVLKQAVAHLRRVDPVMAEVISVVGVEPPGSATEGFQGLASAIVYQQISGSAADAIVRRLKERARTEEFPGAEWFVDRSEADLRACGLSPQKMRYLRDLSERTVDGRLDLRRLRRWEDARIIEALTQVLGIGRWTAEMYLIFALGRPDVLPVDDLGVRKGFRHLYGFANLPARSTMLRLGERWRPYRSYATHYLWASLDRPAWEGLRRATKSFRGRSSHRSPKLVQIPRRP